MSLTLLLHKYKQCSVRQTKVATIFNIYWELNYLYSRHII